MSPKFQKVRPSMAEVRPLSQLTLYMVLENMEPGGSPWEASVPETTSNLHLEPLSAAKVAPDEGKSFAAPPEATVAFTSIAFSPVAIDGREEGTAVSELDAVDVADATRSVDGNLFVAPLGSMQLA